MMRFSGSLGKRWAGETWVGQGRVLGESGEHRLLFSTPWLAVVLCCRNAKRLFGGAASF